MTTYLWTIQQLDRLTADGFVVTVHYNVSATDGTYSANTYGTVGYQEQPGETYTPYDQLTEAQVVGWTKQWFKMASNKYAYYDTNLSLFSGQTPPTA